MAYKRKALSAKESAALEPSSNLKFMRINQKKTLLLFCLSLLCFSNVTQAAYEEYHPQVESENSFQVIGRGVLNAVALPLEVSSSLARETQIHSRLWPFSYVPRMVNNIFYRGASATHDIFLLPWYAPFTADTKPWTRGMGLPDYPWNINP